MPDPNDIPVTKEEKKFGPWTRGQQIGSGGQSRVYEARKGEGSKFVALKVIKTSHLKKAARFIQEVKAHVKLSEANTENIIPVLDHHLEEFENGGVRGYIAMPRAHWSLEDAIHLLREGVKSALDSYYLFEYS